MPEASATRTVTVINSQGLHARAAVLLAELVRRFQAKVELIANDRRRVAPTDVLQTLSLGAVQGEELTVVATGDDAQAALDAVADLFAHKFGEDLETQKQEP
jgi:phosphocarrier protein HPr